MYEENAGKMQRFKYFLRECKRVLKITKKPNSFEFKSIVKVTGLGILVIGFIGFVIQMIYNVIIG